jgi:hypothetical protein
VLFGTADADLRPRPRDKTTLPPFDGSHYSFRLTYNLVSETSGSHSFRVSSVGHATLYVNDELALNNFNWQCPRKAFYAFGSPEVRSVTQSPTLQLSETVGS